MAQQSKSLLAKYGKALKTAHEQHKNDETEYSNFGELPEGIENGIAQLVECKFGEYEKGDLQGESFFYAAGVVLLPKEVNGIPVEGLRTSIMRPLCETDRASTEDQVKWIYNELRKLGVDTANLELEDLESTVEALKEAQPYFRFRTWKGKPSEQFPNPRTQHSWSGTCDYEPEENVNGVEDKTKPVTKSAPATKQPSKTPAKPAATSTKPPVKGKPSARKPEPEPEEVFDDGAEDLNNLAELADGGDEDAKAKLEELAVDKGVTEKQIEDAISWVQVVSWINGEEEPPAEEEAEEEWVPEKDGLYGYCPPDAKTKKPGKKIEVIVLSVNEAKKQVVVKNMNDGKTKYTIGFDKLEEAP